MGVAPVPSCAATRATRRQPRRLWSPHPLCCVGGSSGSPLGCGVPSMTLRLPDPRPGLQRGQLAQTGDGSSLPGRSSPSPPAMREDTVTPGHSGPRASPPAPSLLRMGDPEELPAPLGLEFISPTGHGPSLISEG